MKLSLKVLIPLLFFAITLHAQTKIGISANVNYGKLYSTASDWKSGFTLGLYQEKQWTETIKYRIEANYIQRGTVTNERHYTYPNYDPGWMYISDIEISLSYIEIPFLLKWNFSKGYFINLEPFIGVSLSLPISSDYSISSSDQLNPIPLNPNKPGLIEVYADDGQNELKPNFSLYLGFDYNFNKIQFNIRYGIDLIPLEYINKLKGIKEHMHYFSLGVSVPVNNSEDKDK